MLRCLRKSSTLPAASSGNGFHRPSSTTTSTYDCQSSMLFISDDDASSSNLATRRAVALIPGAASSCVATDVIRPSSSCASSTITMSCSGRICPSDKASMASRAWFVTMTCASRVLARARSAKQSSPCGHRDAPMHSLAVTLTCFHARSETLLSKLSRSPSSVSDAHSCNSLTCRPTREI